MQTTTPAEYAQSRIAAERSRQDEQWGNVKDRPASDLDPKTWLVVMTEELGKLSQAILHTDRQAGERDGMIEHYLTTTTAVGAAWLEMFAV